MWQTKEKQQEEEGRKKRAKERDGGMKDQNEHPFRRKDEKGCKNGFPEP